MLIGLKLKMNIKKLLIQFKELKKLLLENSKKELHFYKKTLTLFNFLNTSVTLQNNTISKKNHGTKYSKYSLKSLPLPQSKPIQVLLLKLLNYVMNF